LIARRKWVAYIDPVDVRFNAFTEQPLPTSQAVMFCLMDVSGSMGEREKDLAKRFFVLLHLFLNRRYEKVDIVFIRHTHDAQEVDEQTFFYSRQSGGTIVSTALEKMLEIQKERYATADWNIYAAQASDGYTQSGDAKRCAELLETELMPICQYYAYIEILDEREMEVFLERRGRRGIVARLSAWSPRIGRISRPSASQNPLTFSRSFTSCSEAGDGVTTPLFTEPEWTFETLDRVLKAVEEIAIQDLKLEVYPNQIEIISTEQMLDAYSAMVCR